MRSGARCFIGPEAAQAGAERRRQALPVQTASGRRAAPGSGCAAVEPINAAHPTRGGAAAGDDQRAAPSMLCPGLCGHGLQNGRLEVEVEV